MKTDLSPLANFITARTQSIVDAWLDAVASQPETDFSDNRTFPQFLEEIPILCAELAARLTSPPHTRAESAAAGDRGPENSRWRPGYRLDELIREVALLRQVLTEDCLDEFAAVHPPLSDSTRRAAERIIHEFLDDTLAAAARQSTAEHEQNLLPSSRVMFNRPTERGIQAPPEKPPAAGRKLRILVVEDHDSTAAVMTKLLQRDGHEVTTAATVHHALDLLKLQQFDLLLSDLGLPDGNGFQVMREVSRVSKAKGIAVSGYGMEEDVARSNEAGFSAHLTKPVNVEELQETIQLITSEW